MNKSLKHDKIFRKAMENPMVAHEFLNAHLPEPIRKLMEFPSLKMENTSFVESNLKDSISDVLFSAKLNGQDGYLYLLLEHQSKPDHFMAFRLFKYMINICDRYLIENPKARVLPLVCPLVFYNGKKQYGAARNLWDLFENNKLARETWINDYKLVNVHEIPDTELKKRAWSGVLEFFLKHIHARNLVEKWWEMADNLPELVKMQIGYDYVEMILFYTLTKIEASDRIELEKILTSKLNKETGEKLMTSLAYHWKQEGRAEGKAEGKAEGMRLGKAYGMDVGRTEGIQIGEAKGKAKAMKLVAKNMLSQECDISLISAVTGLDEGTILSLSKK